LMGLVRWGKKKKVERAVQRIEVLTPGSSSPKNSQNENGHAKNGTSANFRDYNTEKVKLKKRPSARPPEKDPREKIGQEKKKGREARRRSKLASPKTAQHVAGLLTRGGERLLDLRNSKEKGIGTIFTVLI